MFEILVGDCRAVLRSLPPESVHACITSPPYWSLRDYGLEPVVWGGNPTCNHKWGMWDERHDVRAPTIHAKSRTTNRYWGSPSRRFDGNHEKHTAGQTCQRCWAWRGALGMEPTVELYVAHIVEAFQAVRRVLRTDGTLWVNMGDSYEAKSLVGMPWRVALALQKDGWILRNSIIWEKPNAKPDGAVDRCTVSHEYVFLFARQARYFFDQDAIREPYAESSLRDAERRYGYGEGSKYHQAIQAGLHGTGGLNDPSVTRDKFYRHMGRNRRTVWRVPTAGFPGAHFAVFPEALVEPMVLAGTSSAGCCATCGRPWEREDNAAWRAACGCHADPAPCTVLDPFAGSGTVGVVALRLGRRFVGIEMNPDYARMAEQRVSGVQMRLPMV